MDEILGALAFAVIALAQVLAVIAARATIAGPPDRGSKKILIGSSRSTPTAVLVAMLLTLADPGPVAAGQIEQQNFEIPGTGYELLLEEIDGMPKELGYPLLAAIDTWLSIQFDLPRFHSHPHIEFVSPERLASLRYRNLLSTVANERADQVRSVAHDTVAIYIDSERTIYLSNGWMGGKLAYLSVLVHELVHHAQNLAGLKYECVQEREKLAYGAQQRWLELFGRSLEQDFELDGFSLLPKIRCMN